MERWLWRVLTRIHKLADEGRVRFTYKALRELEALDLGFDDSDACKLLSDLTTSDCTGRLRSEPRGDWMYVFKPSVSGTVVYVKLIVGSECRVVSFHEDVSEGEEEKI